MASKTDQTTPQESVPPTSRRPRPDPNPRPNPQAPRYKFTDWAMI